jgi:hypothetical protein
MRKIEPCRISEWDEDLLREEMEAASAAAKTLPRAAITRVTPTRVVLNPVREKIASVMGAGHEYSYADLCDALPDVNPKSISAALQNMRYSGKLHSRIAEGRKRAYWLESEAR